MTAVVEEGARRSYGTILAGTDATVVYTCPVGATAAYLTWISISDDAADARTVSLSWTDASKALTYALGFQIDLDANAQLRLELDLVLDVGDTLNATGSAAGISVVVTAKELARRKA